MYQQADIEKTCLEMFRVLSEANIQPALSTTPKTEQEGLAVASIAQDVVV